MLDLPDVIILYLTTPTAAADLTILLLISACMVLTYGPSPTSTLRSSQKLLLLPLLLHLTSQRISLCLDTLLSPLARCLGLVALGLHFFLQDTLTLLLSLGLVDLKTGTSEKAL